MKSRVTARSAKAWRVAAALVCFATTFAAPTVRAAYPTRNARASTVGRATHGNAARIERLTESGTLHITKAAGFVVEASGHVTGTLNGLLALRLTLVSTSRLTSTFSGHPRSGSLSGQGAGTYHLAGAIAVFSGTVSITGGSGTYAHAFGTDIHVSGTMNRQKKTVTLHVAGQIRL